MTRSIRSALHQRLLEVLVEARLKAGLTQTVLAERLDRPQSFVAKYENGERRIDVVEFVELAEALGAKPKRLFAKLLS